MKTLNVDKQNSIFYVTLNRPDKKNAMNLEMIQELKSLFLELNIDSDCKAVLLSGSAEVFSAGADLNWMQEQITNSKEQNVKESEILFDMFLSLYDFKKPLISFAEKFVMGGALGLVACSDYSFAEESTKFCFSETKLGLAPAVISPFILSKCEQSKVKPYLLFAETFNASKAYELGLIHMYGSKTEMQTSLKNLTESIKSLDLNAIIETKALIKTINSKNLVQHKKVTTELISHLRVQPEAQSRIKNFLSKSLK